MPQQRERSGRPSGARRARHLFALFAAGLFAASVGAAEVAFDRYEVDTGAVRETVLTGFFLGNPVADIALLGVDERGHRRVRILVLAAGEWKPALSAALRPGALFVGVVGRDAPAGGKVDRLFTYQRGRLNWFDPETKTERLLVRSETRYRGHGDEGIHAIDIARDLNGDGRDDLVLPAADGFWIATQTPSGAFAEPVQFGPPEPYLTVAFGEFPTYAEAGINPATLPWYLSRVHQADYNHDGRPDLVFWNENHFDVHFQNEHGQFHPVAKAFQTDVPFDVDGTYALAFKYNDENPLRLILGLRKKTRITMLHTLRDVNADGVADLTTLSLEGRSLANHRGVYRVHFGAKEPGRTVFAREADVVIRPRGKAGALQASSYASVWMRDFDGDGDIDVLFRDAVMGLGGMVRAIAGKSVALNVEFHRMEEDGVSRQRGVRRKIRPRFYPIGTGVFFPPVLTGDLHGDGRLDLVVGKGRRELRIFAGVDGPDAFARKPQKVPVALPDDERNTRLVDFNRDGKQDILIHNTRAKPHRLTTLIAR